MILSSASHFSRMLCFSTKELVRMLWDTFLAIISPKIFTSSASLLNCSSFLSGALWMNFVHLLLAYITKVRIRWAFSVCIKVCISIPHPLARYILDLLHSCYQVGCWKLEMRCDWLCSFFAKSFWLGILPNGEASYLLWRAARFEGFAASDKNVALNILSFFLGGKVGLVVEVCQLSRTHQWYCSLRCHTCLDCPGSALSLLFQLGQLSKELIRLVNKASATVDLLLTASSVILSRAESMVLPLRCITITWLKHWIWLTQSSRRSRSISFASPQLVKGWRTFPLLENSGPLPYLQSTGVTNSFLFLLGMKLYFYNDWILLFYIELYWLHF